MRRFVLFILAASILSCVSNAQESFYEIYHKYYNRYVKALGVNMTVAKKLEPQVFKLSNYLLLYNGYMCEGKLDSAYSIKTKVVDLLKLDNDTISICLNEGSGGGGGYVYASGNNYDIQFNLGDLFYSDSDFKYYNNKDSLVAGKKVKTQNLYIDTAKIVGLALYVTGQYLYISNGIVTPFLQLGELSINGVTISDITSGTTLATKEYVDAIDVGIPSRLNLDNVILDTLTLGGKYLMYSTSGNTISTKSYVDGLFAGLNTVINTQTLNVDEINIGGYSLTGATTGGNIATQLYVDGKVNEFKKSDTLKSKYIYATDKNFIGQNNDYIYNDNDTLKVSINNNNVAGIYNNGIKTNIIGTNNNNINFSSGVDIIANNNTNIKVKEDSILLNGVVSSNNKIKIKDWQTSITDDDDVVTKGYVGNIGGFTPTSFATDYPTMTSDSLPEGSVNKYVSGDLYEDYGIDLSVQYNEIGQYLMGSYSVVYKDNNYLIQYYSTTRNIKVYEILNDSLYLKADFVGNDASVTNSGVLIYDTYLYYFGFNGSNIMIDNSPDDKFVESSGNYACYVRSVNGLVVSAYVSDNGGQSFSQITNLRFPFSYKNFAIDKDGYLFYISGNYLYKYKNGSHLDSVYVSSTNGRLINIADKYIAIEVYNSNVAVYDANLNLKYSDNYFFGVSSRAFPLAKSGSYVSGVTYYSYNTTQGTAKIVAFLDGGGVYSHEDDVMNPQISLINDNVWIVWEVDPYVYYVTYDNVSGGFRFTNIKKINANTNIVYLFDGKKILAEIRNAGLLYLYKYNTTVNGDKILTYQDIGENEVNAIKYANAPSANNPFVTTNDIPGSVFGFFQCDTLHDQPTGTYIISSNAIYEHGVKDTTNGFWLDAGYYEVTINMDIYFYYAATPTLEFSGIHIDYLAYRFFVGIDSSNVYSGYFSKTFVIKANDSSDLTIYIMPFNADIEYRNIYLYIKKISNL